MPVIPERDWTVGVHTVERPGVTAEDALEIRISRPGWELLTGTVAVVRASLVYADQTITNEAVLAGGTLKGGQTESILTWDWPGENNGQGGRRVIRPESLKLDFHVIQPCRARIEMDAIRYAVNQQAKEDRIG